MNSEKKGTSKDDSSSKVSEINSELPSVYDPFRSPDTYYDYEYPTYDNYYYDEDLY